ncbi:MAG: preprotein translocase subunit SecF, partial [Ilumatobacteraceae bacterium]
MSTDVMPTTHARRGRGGRLYHGETAIDFYGRRWWGLGVSALLIVVTIVSLFANGLNLGLDFKGGVAWEVPSTHLTVDQARALLSANQIDGTNAKIQERTSASGSVLLIQVGDQPVAKRQQIQEALATAAQVSTDAVSVNSVSSTWGRSITEKAIRALIIFLILVAMFIAWRLEWRMAVAAIIAMLHDVLISVGVYSLFGFEVAPATVIAFLTILGFSLYDTIVVFDKVHENAKRYAGGRTTYREIVNLSMNQTLMRSLNTSLAAVLPVLSLLVVGSWILGAIALQDFAVALLVGLVTGSYSSIFIATPILAMLKDREPKWRVVR